MWRTRWAAVACVLIYLAMGAAYLEVVPAWEAPDEPWHAVYIERLAAGRLPTAAETYEWHQPPAYYALMAAGLRWLGLSQLPRWQSNPRHPFAAAALAHPPNDPAESPLRLLRALSGLIGTLVVALTWATARRVWRGEPGIAAAAALLVALWPQFLFISHSLSNDTLAAVAGALMTFGLVRLVVAPHRPRPGAVALAVGLALGVFTKLNVLAITPAAALAALAVWRTGGALRGSALRALAAALVVPVAVALGVALAWPQTFAGLLATARDRVTGTGAGLDAGALVRLVAEMAVTFIGRFGWLNVSLPRLPTVTIGLLLGLGGLGLFRLRGCPARLRWGVAVLATAAAAMSAAAVKNLLADPQPQGRFLFPALAAIAVVVVVGWRLIVGERRWTMAVTVAGLGLVVVNGWVVGVLLPAAYATSRQPASQLLWRSMGATPDAHARLPLTRSIEVVQSFRASSSQPFEVSVPVASWPGDHAVDVTMRVKDASGRELGVERMDALPRNRWLSMLVTPGRQPLVQPLAFTIYSAASNTSDTVELWSTTGDVTADGHLEVNRRRQPNDLVLLVTAPPDAGSTARPPPTVTVP